MIATAAAFVALWLWERRNLSRWDAGARIAFWSFWAIALAWSVAVHLHVRVPTLPDLTTALFRPLWQKYLRRRPDIYW